MYDKREAFANLPDQKRNIPRNFANNYEDDCAENSIFYESERKPDQKKAEFHCRRGCSVKWPLKGNKYRFVGVAQHRKPLADKHN